MDFQEQVIEKSFEQPVLVDFWAPWCGPCRVLGPTIEQIAEEQEEQWKLVKVNTEDEQAIAQEYNIKSIPNVKLFHKGAVIGEFTGALPRTAILNWLKENLPSEDKLVYQQILQDLEINQAEALGQLKSFVSDFPNHQEAKLKLAQELVFSEPTYSLDLVKDINMADKHYDQANYIKDLVTFLQHEPEDSPVGKKISAAQLAIKNKDMEAAIQLLIEATTIDKNYSKEMPRKSSIALFHSLGLKHPLTKAYRWKFDMALY